MDKKYIDRKIENCQKLVDTAIDPAQKEIYQGYLEFWQKKITKSNRKTDTETGEEPSIPLTEEPQKEEIDTSNYVSGREILKGTEYELPQREEKKEIEGKAILERELQDAKDKLEELEREEEFKLAYPNKNAYYNRDNKTYKTNAFKEFLISKE